MVKIILITLVIIVILLPILWVLGNYCFVSLFVLIIIWSNEHSLAVTGATIGGAAAVTDNKKIDK